MLSLFRTLMLLAVSGVLIFIFFAAGIIVLAVIAGILITLSILLWLKKQNFIENYRASQHPHKTDNTQSHDSRANIIDGEYEDVTHTKTKSGNSL